VHYHFLDAATFERRVAAGEFLEHAVVYGHRYGTLGTEVYHHLDAGNDVLLNIDVQGATAVRKNAAADHKLRGALLSIFLTPPSLAVLEQRLRKRGSDSEEVVQKRLAAARGEIAEWRNFDYLLFSTTIEEDLRRFLTILEAERMRQARAIPPEGF
jgi:guanylate kinase